VADIRNVIYGIYKNCVIFNTKTGPSYLFISFQRSGSVEDQRGKIYTRSYRSQEKIDLVCASVVEESKMSISRGSHVGLREIIIWWI